MDTPRILAVNDVHLVAPKPALEDVHAFYGDLIGLDRVDSGAEGGAAVFRGHPRSGPKIVFSLGRRPEARTLCRDVLIQVPSLTDCADQMIRLGTTPVRSQGWTHHDRLLSTLDPAGNRVELVAYHVL